MTFIGDYYTSFMGHFKRHEYIQIIKSSFKRGDKIQDGDNVYLKAEFNNNDSKKEKPWLWCNCDSYCVRSSSRDGFRIWKVGSNGSVKRSSTVYFRDPGCGNKMISALDGYVKMKYSERNSCETWNIKY